MTKHLTKKVDSIDGTLNATHFIGDLLQNEDIETYIAEIGTDGALIDCSAPKSVIGEPKLKEFIKLIDLKEEDLTMSDS